MPQLQFNKDICPRRFTFTIEWDQLRDIWDLSVRYAAQDESPQGAERVELPPTFEPRILAFVYQATLEDWIDMTPKTSAATFRRLAFNIKQKV